MRQTQRYMPNATAANARPPITMAASAKPGPTKPSGVDLPEIPTMKAIATPITLPPTLNPEASNTPSWRVVSGFVVRSALRSKYQPTIDGQVCALKKLRSYEQTAAPKRF
jgi:hypothetical protein